MIVISCYFGKKNTSINRAPLESKCYFFSNNNKIKNKAQSMGWQFVLIDHMPIEKDYRISSLQSKYVKFLQFDKNLIKWVEGENIIYFDHKLNVQKNNIVSAKDLCKTEILIKNHPTQNSIQDEILDSSKQPRYAKAMEETIRWVESKVNKEGYIYENMMMATGFILFADVKGAQQLCDEVYNTCEELGQPECQIIWGVLSQKFEKNITRIGWKEIDIGKAPYSFTIRASAYIKRVIKRVLGRL